MFITKVRGSAHCSCDVCNLLFKNIWRVSDDTVAKVVNKSNFLLLASKDPCLVSGLQYITTVRECG